jgi:hypothetical protein
MTIRDAEERTWKCADCRLTWIPRRSLVLSLPEDFLPRISQKTISAPVCGRRLICPACELPSFRTLSLRSIEFDHCYYCEGIVLDPGEMLKQIRGDIESEQSTNPLYAVGTGFEAVGLFFDMCRFFL